MSGSSRAAAGLLAVLILGAPAVAFAQAATTGVQLAAAYTVRSDVVYHTAGRAELTRDLYVPDRAGEAPVPVVVLTGRSAGAHLALIAGMLPPGSPLANECASDAEIRNNRLVPARAAAVVNWYGITDVADLLEGPHRRLYAEKWIGARSDGAEIARSVSPIRHVRRDLPPILTIHGDADPSVLYGHATRLHEALDEAGAVGELITVPQGGHAHRGARPGADGTADAGGRVAVPGDVPGGEAPAGRGAAAHRRGAATHRLRRLRDLHAPRRRDRHAAPGGESRPVLCIGCASRGEHQR